MRYPNACRVRTHLASGMANPDPTLRMTKDLLSKNACEQDMNLAQSRESEYLRECWATTEHKEAVAAFFFGEAAGAISVVLAAP